MYRPGITAENAEILLPILRAGYGKVELTEEQDKYVKRFVECLLSELQKPAVDDYLSGLDEASWNLIQERISKKTTEPNIQLIRPPSSYNPESDQGQEHPDDHRA